MRKPQLMIQSDAPFRVFCNTCRRWVDDSRIAVAGTHDADESQPVQTGRGISPLPEQTDHTVWDMPEEDAPPE